MRKRMNRTWAEIPKAEVERLADGLTAKTYAADWMTDDSGFAFAEAILGQRLELSFPNDATLTLSFRSETELAWDDSDGAQGSGFYRALSAPGCPKVVFVHQYRDGLWPPTCVDLVLDLETGYATVVIAQLGGDERPREAVHTIRFGEITGIPHPADAEPHGYTTDLIGKAIHWEMPAFTKKPPIKHIYLSPLYYGIFMTREDGTCYMAADPADYLRIRGNLYLVSVIEARRSGIQLNFLINTDLLEDVVGHFGISAGNERGQDEPKIVCTVMTGRKGTFVPMETLW